MFYYVNFYWEDAQMAKIPTYATYLYNYCIARKESPDSEFEGCDDPDGHLKLLHLWPVKLLQAGRMNYA